MRLNPEKMTEHGFSFESTDDLLLYASNLVEYFRYHNKTLTKTQERKITAIQEALECLDLEVNEQ